MALFLTLRQKQLLVLGSLAVDQPRSGFDLMVSTGLSSGALYPLLISMEEVGLLRSAWADTRPPRAKLYRLAHSPNQAVAPGHNGGGEQ